MGCSNSKTRKNTSSTRTHASRNPRLRYDPLEAVDSGMFPHVSVSEAGDNDDRRDLEESVNTSPAGLHRQPQSADGGGGDAARRHNVVSPALSTGDADEPYRPMAVTRKSLSDLKRVKTGEKVRRWQRVGGDTEEQSVGIVRVPPCGGDAREAREDGGMQSAPHTPPRKLSTSPPLHPQENALQQLAAQLHPNANVEGPDRDAGGGAMESTDSDEENRHGSSLSGVSGGGGPPVWERRISALASRRCQHQRITPRMRSSSETTARFCDAGESHHLPVAAAAVVVVEHPQVPRGVADTIPLCSGDDAQPAHDDPQGVPGESFDSSARTTTANTSIASPHRRGRLVDTPVNDPATTSSSKNSTPATIAAPKVMGEQARFVVVAKVNNPTTGINLVYRKSEQVIGLGSSASVYLGSVTTTITNAPNNNNSSSASTEQPPPQQRKFLTAVKEILVSPPAILMESPAGEQLSSRQRMTAVEAIKTAQDVVQMLRLEFRLLKSLDACPQVVRVLHVAITTPEGGPNGDDGDASGRNFFSGGSPRKRPAQEDHDATIGGGFPLHFKPQRARMFLEYVRHGTLSQETRRLASLFEVPPLPLRAGGGLGRIAAPSSGACSPITASPTTRGGLEAGPTPRSATDTPDLAFPQVRNNNNLSPPMSTTATSGASWAGPRMHELTARAYMRDVLLGLCYLHENRCIHRDVKPQNILVHSLVEDMYSTYFPVCLEDDVMKFNAPTPDDSEVDEEFPPAAAKTKKRSRQGKKRQDGKKQTVESGRNAATRDRGGGAGSAASTATATNSEDRGKRHQLLMDDGEDDQQQQGGGGGPREQQQQLLQQQRSHCALDDLVAPTHQPAAAADPPLPASPPIPAIATTIEAHKDTGGVPVVCKAVTKPSTRYQHANHRQKHKSLIKLSDFGSARWTIPTNAEQGEGGAAGYLRDTVNAGCKTTMNVVGTAPYMSPEAIRGRFSEASDIWSFGITFLELLLPQPGVATASSSSADQKEDPPSTATVWRRLRARDAFQLILQIASLQEPNHMPDLPAHVSPECRDMLRRCFAMRPSDRPTAVELLQGTYFGSTTWIPRRIASLDIEPPWRSKHDHPEPTQ